MGINRSKASVFVVGAALGACYERYTGKKILKSLLTLDMANGAGGRKLASFFPELTQNNVNFRDLLFGGFMAMCYYAYLVVIIADLSIFDCSVQLDGTKTMDVDPSIPCYVSEHAQKVQQPTLLVCATYILHRLPITTCREKC